MPKLSRAKRISSRGAEASICPKYCCSLLPRAPHLACKSFSHMLGVAAKHSVQSTSPSLCDFMGITISACVLGVDSKNSAHPSEDATQRKDLWAFHIPIKACLDWGVEAESGKRCKRKVKWIRPKCKIGSELDQQSESSFKGQHKFLILAKSQRLFYASVSRPPQPHPQSHAGKHAHSHKDD